jgi:hypothetical protein
MPDESIVNPVALAAKERAIANSQIDHGVIYKHVAANKIEIFGPKTFSVCPQCDNTYRLFNNPRWKGDQSVCQACADENFAPTRKVMQDIERKYAEQEKRKQLEYCGPFTALSGAPA